MPALRPILGVNAQGDQVKAVQTNLGKIGLTLPTTETSQGLFGTGTVDAIKQFQAQNKLPITGVIDATTLAMLNNAAAVAGTNQSHVSGQLVMDHGLPANGITVRLYNIGYLNVATKLAETKTDTNGVYSLVYTAPAAGVNIEVRVVDAQAKETTVSSIVYNTPAQLVLNLVAPASVQPLASEFQRLSTDVQNAIGGSGIQDLAKAQESDTQQDLSLLNQTTGWDARLLALAASAAQHAATTGLGLDVLYALFRTGLPTDETLTLIPPATIGTALTKANQAGIANFTAQQITAAVSAFTAYATKTNLGIKVPGAPSSFSDLLGNIVTDSGQQSSFIGAFLDSNDFGS